MKAQWPLISLGELLRLERRPVEVVADREYQEIGIYSYGRGIFHKQPRFGLEVGNKDLYQVKEGDLIFQITFAWEGAIALCGKTEDGLYGSVRYPTYRVNPTKCFAPFLARYLCTREGLDQINRICPGSAGRNRVLALGRLSEVRVPLPPLHEQRRIVARIDALAPKIEQAKELRERTVQETKALASFGSQSVLAARTALSDKAPLGSLVTIRGGGTPAKNNPTYWNGCVPWITPKDMKRREMTDAIDHISEEATHDTAAKLIPAGAVLIVVRGMILTHTVPVAILRSAAAINQDMKALAPQPVLSPEYLCAVLWALNSKLLKLVDRSSHDTRKLETSKLMAFEIPVPSLEDQRCVLAELDELQAKIDIIRTRQAETHADVFVRRKGDEGRRRPMRMPIAPQATGRRAG